MCRRAGGWARSAMFRRRAAVRTRLGPGPGSAWGPGAEQAAQARAVPGIRRGKQLRVRMRDVARHRPAAATIAVARIAPCSHAGIPSGAVPTASAYSRHGHGILLPPAHNSPGGIGVPGEDRKPR